MTDSDAKAAATPRRELERQIMDSGIPKNEREWWAREEIETLRDDLAAANAERKQYRGDGILLWQHGIDQAGLASMLTEDNARMRKAGCALAEASLHVIREYDGLHRLSLAVANWSQAVADEGRRAPPTAWDTNPQCCFDDVAWQMRMHYHKHGPRWWEWSRNVDAVWGAILRLAMRELVKTGWKP